MSNLKPIASWKEPGQQRVLFPDIADVIFRSANHASPYLGDWAEEFVAAVSGGTRLITDATAICPDVEIEPGWYVEVKAVGPRNNFPMYRQRYLKYLRLVRSGARLQFAFVHHTVNAADLRSRSHLRGALAANVTHLTVIPAQTLFQEVRRIVREKGWTHCAKRKAAYRAVVRLGSRWLDQFRFAKPHRPCRTFRTQVYDADVWFVPIRLYKTSWPARARVGIHEPEVRAAAPIMHDELRSGWHAVALQHYLDGRKGRVVLDRNVEWYERMRREYHIGRRGYSLVQRRNVLNALAQMAEDRPVAAGVEDKLLPYIDAWVAEQADAEGRDAVPF